MKWNARTQASGRVRLALHNHTVLDNGKVLQEIVLVVDVEEADNLRQERARRNDLSTRGPTALRRIIHEALARILKRGLRLEIVREEVANRHFVRRANAVVRRRTAQAASRDSIDEIRRTVRSDRNRREPVVERALDARTSRWGIYLSRRRISAT